jgi:hypothetical protein
MTTNASPMRRSHERPKLRFCIRILDFETGRPFCLDNLKLGSHIIGCLISKTCRPVDVSTGVSVWKSTALKCFSLFWLRVGAIMVGEGIFESFRDACLWLLIAAELEVGCRLRFLWWTADHPGQSLSYLRIALMRLRRFNAMSMRRRLFVSPSLKSRSRKLISGLDIWNLGDRIRTLDTGNPKASDVQSNQP